MQISGLAQIPSRTNDLSTNWQLSSTTVPRLGDKRDETIQNLNRQYGEGNWRFAWEYGKRYLDFAQACRVYENAYRKHLLHQPKTLTYLSENASNVYDTNISNTQSDLDYSHQEDSATHIQDIAIRRIMAKQGLSFNGNKLIQIRSTSCDNVGQSLSPLKVPFHRPQKVLTNKPNPSVEDFWQCNRVIQFCDAVIKH